MKWVSKDDRTAVFECDFDERSVISLIVDQDQFDAFIQKVIDEKPAYLAIDTEFERRHSYYPHLCLIQVAFPTYEVFLLDPLSKGLDLSGLVPILERPDILKIFHAPSQDLEAFLTFFKCLPKPIFDTQIAVRFCDITDQYEISYANLVALLCEKVLDKTYQDANWQVRPLPKEQLVYAALDVIYLIDLYGMLIQKLKDCGHLDKAHEDSQLLLSAQNFQKDPHYLFTQFMKTSQKKLVDVPKSLIYCLLIWREKTAAQKNVPRGHLISNDEMVKILLQRPKTVSDLEAIMKRDLLEGLAIVELIAEADIVLPEEADESKSSDLSHHDVKKLIDLLKQKRSDVAQQLNLNEQLIATMNDMKKFIVSDKEEQIAFLSGWRRPLFGEAALEIKKAGV